MSLQNDIQDLVLSFFKMIDSDMSYNDGIYTIHVPKKYHNHFRTHSLSITFEKDIALHHNCELVIAGSRILSTVIKICAGKAPISSIKTQTNNNKTVLRYHFFVNFSAIQDMSSITHVDIDLDTCRPVYDINISESSKLSDIVINPQNITQSYNAAADELTKKYNSTKTKFINNANTKFQNEFDLFVDKYDSQIRDIDKTINKKEHESDDPEKIAKFRFDGIKRIREIEGEKMRLIDTLQKKHQINLIHNLIACEIIII